MKITKMALLLVLGLPFAACEPGKPTTNTATTTATPATAATPLPAPRQDDELMVIETEYGKFKIAFYPEIAPKHMAQMKKLTKEGFYAGLGFHRVLPNAMIQGGDPQTRKGDRTLWGMGEPGQETIPAEFSSVPFKRGSVGMARKGNDNNSATSQFFICLEPRPAWDGQYTVVGEVVQGLNNVQIISNMPTEPGGEKVRDKITMTKVYLEKRAAQ
ncbi:MAG: peptidylprolyl isomerase [Acidobacteria bacterium]|nr:peptidylprolyl isomerase [Acidobacteriota bacterium]MBI3427353.1 peptidylprolyl isomerase [Acidobacteriota bacterium]